MPPIVLKRKTLGMPEPTSALDRVLEAIGMLPGPAMARAPKAAKGAAHVISLMGKDWMRAPAAAAGVGGGGGVSDDIIAAAYQRLLPTREGLRSMPIPRLLEEIQKTNPTVTAEALAARLRELAGRSKVALSRHDTPGLVPERDLLLKMGMGTPDGGLHYYMTPMDDPRLAAESFLRALKGGGR